MSRHLTLSPRRTIKCGAVPLIAALVLAACGPAATPTTVPSTPPIAVPGTEAPGSLDALVAAAKAEGTLTTIALPHDWCNYGMVIDGFKAKYGLAVNELNPNANSGQKLEAIRASENSPGLQAPDVIDMGFTFGPSAKDEGLLQPYKVSTWDTIPADAKDAEGYWYGDYYGVLSFMVNTDVIKTAPQDWADLVEPEYKSSVGLSGDPRTAHQAIMSVLAAALASSGSLDNAQAGLDFFANLNLIGNFVPLISNNVLVAGGQTPIRITWDYNALYGKDLMAGNPPIEVVVPTTGRLASVYVQAISKYAPHPNAARLWMEYLYSDEGQLAWLSPPGYCHPIRQSDLEKRGVIPADLKAKLPSVEGVVFPSAAQLTAASQWITQNWDRVVGAEVKPGP
jgi:putative spermidine/putrescine transport system substrate-binding protein